MVMMTIDSFTGQIDEISDDSDDAIPSSSDVIFFLKMMKKLWS